MKIVYCCPAHTTGSEKVMRIVEVLVSADAFEVYDTFSGFEKFLRHDPSCGHLFILHASTQTHLERFISFHELLIGRKIILVLPDRERNTLILGHMLRPRFITYNDGDFLEMASVLCHIINPPSCKTKSPQQGKF